MPAGNRPQRTVTCSGIYQIRCGATGKIYIGSALNVAARWEQHRRDLRRGSHINPHLQSAWNVYSEAAFQFTLLERTGRGARLRVEQEWLDKTSCTDPRMGFNIKRQATSAGAGCARAIEGFRDPSGKSVTIVGLSDFCRQHRLDYRSMHRLTTGRSKLKSYKGWTHTNSRRQRDYIKIHEGFIGPDGKPAGPIRNLAAFCRQHGLNDSHMAAVAARRIISHRGWTHAQGRKREPFKTYAGFVAPDGTATRITHLPAFCLANGLSKVHMYGLMSGKRKRHKGWTWKHHDA